MTRPDLPYRVELTRYIHLNPLRSKLVKNVRELDTYKYCGHGVIQGRFNNDWQDRNYILKRFGLKISVAKRGYKRFVEKGIAQGKREDLTGGGLVRSVGGWSALKALRRARAHIKGDERILGDGDFVKQQLDKANEKLEREYQIRALGFGIDKIIGRGADVLWIQRDRVVAVGKSRDVVQA